MRKILFNSFFLLLTFNSLSGVDIELYQGIEGSNIIDMESDNLSLDIDYRSFTTGIKLGYKEAYWDLFSIEKIYHLEIDYDHSDTVLSHLDLESTTSLLESENRYWGMEMGLYKSWFSLLWVEESPILNFNIDLPLIPEYYTMGIEYIENRLDIESIDLFGSFNLFFNPEWRSTSYYFDLQYNDFNLHLVTRDLKIYELAPFQDTDNMGFLIDLESDLCFETTLTIDRDIWKEELGYSILKFNIYDKNIRGLANYNVFLDLIFNPNGEEEIPVTYWSLNNQFSLHSFNLAANYAKVTIGEFGLSSTTSPFIYSTLAYYHMQSFIIDWEINSWGIGLSQNLDKKWGELQWGVTYNRFTMDLGNIYYRYQKYVLSNLTDSSPQYTYKPTYDHINIIGLNLEYSIEIMEYIGVEFSLGQIIPFTDEMFSGFFEDLFSKENSGSGNSTGSGESSDISGGLDFSIMFIVKL